MNSDTFENTITFPDPVAQERYLALVGIDHIKERVAREASIILNPSSIEEWSKKFYKEEISLIKLFKNRPPLFIFSGDVGTGKTTLAETFGDQIARSEGVKITLYKLSLNARGSGIVGEMTKLISDSFEYIRNEARSQANSKTALVLFIDEADALAQSREAVQMHHEDKAGVNAVIRGIDSLNDLPVPVMVIMCTNRHSAIDPAVHRRSAVTFEFGRPSKDQCQILLKTYLDDLNLSENQINQLASMCVPYDGLTYGYT
jgi:AAA+ superfamily predicted ATPase